MLPQTTTLFHLVIEKFDNIRNADYIIWGCANVNYVLLEGGENHMCDFIKTLTKERGWSHLDNNNLFLN